MFRIIIILFICYLFIYASCDRRVNCNVSIYSFDTKIRAYPDLDSINIYDTIWLETAFPTNLIDLRSGNNVNYAGAENLGTSIDFLKFTGGDLLNPGVVPAANNFNYRLITGVFVPDAFLPEKNRDYRFIESGNEYKFKLGIIPTQTGVFAIAPSDAANVYTSRNKCDKAGFSITFANQHLYFYEQNRPGYTPSDYERTHMYCFKVK